MSKEINKKMCFSCESSYKLVFDLDETSGFPKFCPFCGDEVYNSEDQPDNNNITDDLTD